MRSGKCRVHGGLSPSGFASPQWKHGRHSKYVPTGLLDRYRESLNDPELHGVESEIAIVDSRVKDLLTKVESGESPMAWAKLAELADAAEKAKADGDKIGQSTAINEMIRQIRVGATVSGAWKETVEMIERKVRLDESRQKRMLELGQFIRAEEFLNFVLAASAIIKENVTERSKLVAINAGFQRLLAGRSTLATGSVAGNGSGGGEPAAPEPPLP